jgi:hypothetical protein
VSKFTFQEYFERQFPADLAAFVEAMPASQRKHFMKSPESYSISMNYLVEPRLALHVIPLERRPYYATALYFTSLMDQAMYQHRQESYERYRRLTDYPKLTGACPGACMYIAEPTMALTHTNLFDVDETDYIQRRSDTVFRNELTLAPILKEGKAYFRQAFPAFLRRHLPHISDPEALYRRIFSDWSEVQANPFLLADPKHESGSFHLAAGYGPVVEVHSDYSGLFVTTLTLKDEFCAHLELDFAELSGSFSGLRLRRYLKVEHRLRPRGIPQLTGLPCLRKPGCSAELKVEPLICSKHMTSAGRGDFLVEWLGRRTYDQESSFPLLGGGCVLRFYYSQGELGAFCLEGVDATVFNEMPLFEQNGR